MTYSEMAAWWGAIIATCILFWDAFKWFHSGSKMFVTVKPNMMRSDKSKDEKFVHIEITNIGSCATTLKDICIIQYKNKFYSLVNKPLNSYFIPTPISSQTLPRLLDPGVMWRGSFKQFDILEQKDLKTGLWYCAVFDSSHKIGTYSKINF